MKAKYGAPKPTEDPTATATARALEELESLKRRIEELESLTDRKKRKPAMSATRISTYRRSYRPSGEKGGDDEGGRESEVSEDEDVDEDEDDEPVVDPLMKHIDLELMRKDRSQCTQQELNQIRRERNRMHAKRTRVRKKVQMEEIQVSGWMGGWVE